MAIDFKSFLQCAPHVIKVRKPILIRGRHGIGKSEVVYQIAESLDLPVVERRASQMTEGDLLGMPSPEYQVNEMDPAELDRYTVFDVEPSVEDWLDWAKENVNGVVWDFVNQNRNHLEHSDDFEPNKVYPSRRSWKRLSDCLVDACLLQEASPVLFNLSCGFVGFEASVAFNDFIKNYERQVTVEDIIDNGEIEKTNEFDINDHSALIEKMEAKEIFKTTLEDKQIQNLANYFVSLPSECCMKLWTALGNGELENTTKLHQATTTDGKKVASHLVEILTGKSEE